MDNTVSAISLTPANDTGVATLQGACALVEGSEVSSSLAAETATSFLADACRVVFMAPPYTIGRISGTNFFTGDVDSDASKNGFTEDARAAEIAAAVPFKKQ